MSEPDVKASDQWLYMEELNLGMSEDAAAAFVAAMKGTIGSVVHNVAEIASEAELDTLDDPEASIDRLRLAQGARAGIGNVLKILRERIPEAYAARLKQDADAAAKARGEEPAEEPAETTDPDLGDDE